MTPPAAAHDALPCAAAPATAHRPWPLLPACGLAAIGLLTLPLRSVGWGASALGAAVALALDLFVSGHGAAKVGHVLPFVLGLGTGLLLHRAPKRATA